MAKQSNIIIADESALFFHLHTNGSGANAGAASETAIRPESPNQIASRYGHPLSSGPSITPTFSNPLLECASTAADFAGFNPDHPLYGGKPVSLLVSQPRHRRRSNTIATRCYPAEPPDGSFYSIRDGLYLATPEFVFARMANFKSEVQLAEIGINLCGRYYLDILANTIEDRVEYATTPERLKRYLEKAPNLKGAHKALKALKWVVANSASPMETKMELQFCNPLWSGGFALPLRHMNYDVLAGRQAYMTEQNEFCIDAVDPVSRTGLEYDGAEAHTEPSKDNRRRNALHAMGWEIFVIDKNVLYNPEATKTAALQIAKRLGTRIQFPKRWNQAYQQLRTDLGLPV